MRRKVMLKLNRRSTLQLTIGVLILFTLLVSSEVFANGITVRVSISSMGVEGNWDDYFPSISADGRSVAFYSGAYNLVAGDTNNEDDVFVHDRQTAQTTRVSVSSSGVQGNDRSFNASISCDSNHVAFGSAADNLVDGDNNDSDDVFVHDRQTGQTMLVSVSSSGVQGNGYSNQLSLSCSGRYVAFQSSASNLVTGDNNGKIDIFVHDRQTGQTTRASVSSSGTEGNNGSLSPSISSDGRYVAFNSFASNLVAGDTNNTLDVFVHDRQTGQTKLVSVSSLGVKGNNYSHQSYISPDGRYVAFESNSSNLVTGDTNGKFDIFVHDLQTAQTTRVSVSSLGVQGNDDSMDPSISFDGRYVAFQDNSDNLVDGADTKGNIYVHDRQTGQTMLVSVSSSGVQGNGGSLNASISSDGKHVAFKSYADNLVDDDNNGRSDIFVHDRPFESDEHTLSGLLLLLLGD